MNRSGSAVAMVAGTAILAALMGLPQTAQAHQSWCDDDRWVVGDHRGWPRESVRVIINGRPFGYRPRVRRSERIGYTIITAPVNEQLASLPSDHQIVVVDGVTYHYYDGAFYKGGPSGTVVPVPVLTSPSAGETVVINVPNANGSYTPVTLQARADGTYVGPQGEVYTTKPELAQLKAMYGK